MAEGKEVRVKLVVVELVSSEDGTASLQVSGTNMMAQIISGGLDSGTLETHKENVCGAVSAFIDKVAIELEAQRGKK